MNKKILQNFFYQSIYQILLIVLPIVTIPIVSRALGPNGIGKYNFVTSIVAYFILFAGLGLANYGIREIALVKDDRRMLSRKFWELEIFNLTFGIIVIVGYSILLIFIPEKTLYLVAGITIGASLLDITWFYSGIEEFRAITVVNMLVKIISFIAIIYFIKDSSHLTRYFAIQSLSIFFSNVTLWIFVFKYISFVKITIKDAWIHFIPALHFFLGKVSIVLYTNLNKTLLGLLSGTLMVGYYTNSMQIISIVVALLGTMDTVLLPRMSNLFHNNDEDAMIYLMKQTIDFQLFISIGAVFGINLINNQFVPWFFGNEFLILRYTIPVLSPVLILIPLGISVVRQYLMPRNRIKQFNISVIVTAIISVILNIILIPIIGIWGTIIAALVSEMVVVIIRMKDLYMNTSFRLPYRNILYYIISGTVMYVLSFSLTKSMSDSIMTTAIQFLIGGSMYMIITSLFKVNPLITFIFKIKK